MSTLTEKAVPMTAAVPEGVTVSVELVSPEIAADWLANHNSKNRNLRQTLAGLYGEDMTEGRWMFNGESISFDADGDMLDGQHRAASVVASGVSQWFLVVRGLDPAVRRTIGGAARRTAGDVLKMEGFTFSNEIAAAARFHMYLTDRVRTRQFTNARVEQYVLDHPSLSGVFQSPLPRVPLSRAMVGYFKWRLSELNAEKAEEFFASWESMANLPKDSPIIVLNSRLNRYVRTSDGWTTREEKASFVFTAWNSWLRGDPRTILRITRAQGGKGRIVIPEPIVSAG